MRAVQEQQAEIEALEAEIAPLQRRLAELEGTPKTAGGAITAAYAVR